MIAPISPGKSQKGTTTAYTEDVTDLVVDATALTEDATNHEEDEIALMEVATSYIEATKPNRLLKQPL